MKNELMFKQYIATLCELHDKAISQLLIDLYWKILEPFTDEQCESAFKELILSSKFFPKPVDFREIIIGKQSNKATEAWLDVVDAVARIGNYKSIKFSDVIIHSVINAMGGWQQLCLVESKDMKWKQKEFERLYEVISQNSGKHPDYLVGLHEQENFRIGNDYKPEIVQIGFYKNSKKLLN